ncbi:MAG: hypothetical protein VW230_02950 [Candidatus Poseidoniales archaeon]
MAGSSSNFAWLSSLLFAILIASPFVGIAAAQNGTISIDLDTVSLDEFVQTEFSSIELWFDVVEDTGLEANATVEIEVRSLEGEVSQNHSHPVSMQPFSSANISQEISSLPFGFSIVNVSIFGDVGVNVSNPTPGVLSFERTIQRLRPMNISIAPLSAIYFESVDEAYNTTGNSSLADGDFLEMTIPILNQGDYNWSGNFSISFSESLTWNYTSEELIIPDSSTFIVQIFSPTKLNEGTLHWNASLSNVSGVLGTHIRTGSVTVLPPPLPSIDIMVNQTVANITAGDIINQSITIMNSGETPFNGTLSCEFDGEEIYSQAMTLLGQTSEHVLLQFQVKPGILRCKLIGSRVDSDSNMELMVLYEMDSAIFEIVGDEQPSAVTGPWNTGDVYQASLLVRNVGSQIGHAKLKMEIDGIEFVGDELELQPNSAGEVDIEFILQDSGEFDIHWELFTEDGAFNGHHNGLMTIDVSPPQTLTTMLTSVAWSETKGLSFNTEIQLENGPQRLVQLSYGTFTGTVEDQVGEFELLLTPGTVSIALSVGQEPCEGVFVIVTPIDWTADVSRSVAMEEFSIDEPTYSVELDPLLLPRRPVKGDIVEVEITFQAIGYFIEKSSTYSILGPEGGVLFSGPAPNLLDSTQQITVTPEFVWPSNDDITLRVLWLVDGKRIETSMSYQSGEVIVEEQSTEVPMLEIFYGVILAGVIIFALRLQKSKDYDSSNIPKKKEKTKHVKPNASYDHDEKRTIDCPECARQLRVPLTYDGKVRCPDCEHSFEVESPATSPAVQQVVEQKDEVKEDPIAESSDGKKEIACPDCERTLRVPNSYEGSVRCPACKCVFKAT